MVFIQANINNLGATREEKGKNKNSNKKYIFFK